MATSPHCRAFHSTSAYVCFLSYRPIHPRATCLFYCSIEAETLCNSTEPNSSSKNREVFWKENIQLLLPFKALTLLWGSWPYCLPGGSTQPSAVRAGPADHSTSLHVDSKHGNSFREATGTSWVLKLSHTPDFQCSKVLKYEWKSKSSNTLQDQMTE